MTEQIIKQEEIHSPSIYFENECFEEDDYCTYCIQSPEHQHHHHHQHSSHQQPIQKDFMPTFYNPFETKHRRRTSRAQFKILETSFYENAKPNATMRRWLAHKLGMTPRSVQVWFQNRRAKAKSQLKKHINAASSSSSSSPSLLSSSPSTSSFIPSPHPLMIPTDSSSSFYSPMMMPMESPTFDQEWPTSISSSSSPNLITPTIPMNDDDYYTLTPPMLSTSSPSSCSSSYDPSQWQYHHQHHPSSSHLDDPLSIMSMYPYPSPTTTLSSSPTNIMCQQYPSIDQQQRRTSYPIDPSNFDKDDVRRLSEPIFHQPIPSTTSDYLLMDHHQTIPLNMVDANNICFM